MSFRLTGDWLAPGDRRETGLTSVRGQTPVSPTPMRIPQRTHVRVNGSSDPRSAVAGGASAAPSAQPDLPALHGRTARRQARHKRARQELLDAESIFQARHAPRIERTPRLRSTQAATLRTIPGLHSNAQHTFRTSPIPGQA